MKPRDWRRHIKAARWTPYERVYRSSALDLADLAKPDGTICRWREDLAEALGIQPRSFDNHLAWLIDHGWIEHVQRPVNRGPDRRPATYRLRDPDTFHSQTFANPNGSSIRNPQRTETPVSIRNPFANLLYESERSEHVALEEHAPGEPTTAARASAPLTAAADSGGRNPAHAKLGPRCVGVLRGACAHEFMAADNVKTVLTIFTPLVRRHIVDPWTSSLTCESAAASSNLTATACRSKRRRSGSGPRLTVTGSSRCSATSCQARPRRQSGLVSRLRSMRCSRRLERGVWSSCASIASHVTRCCRKPRCKSSGVRVPRFTALTVARMELGLCSLTIPMNRRENSSGVSSAWSPSSSVTLSQLACAPGRRAKAASGGHAGGTYAFGQTSGTTADRRRDAVPHVDEQATVARAVELRQQGESYRAVAAQLDAEGRPPRRAASWSAMAVRNVLVRAST